jgi:hypothetical protein
MKLSDFTYIKETRTLATEASSIGKFSDTIEVLSEKTGKKVKFYFTRPEHRDGDIVAWNFETRCDANCKMVIFND